MINLTTQSVVITGANRGLGLALSQVAAEAGAHVVLTSRDPSGAATVAAELSRRGWHAEAYASPLDVSNEGHVRDFGRFCEEHALPDILINNAAVCETGWTGEVIERTLATNVLGPLSLMRMLLPTMRKRRRPRVINLSSGDGELVYLSTSLQTQMSSVTDEEQLLTLLERIAPPRDEFGGVKNPPAHGPTPAYSVSKVSWKE